MNETKLDEAAIKKIENVPQPQDVFFMVDNLQIIQSLLSKQLPPEQFNGVINLFLAFRPNATEEEIQNAVVNKA